MAWLLACRPGSWRDAGSRLAASLQHRHFPPQPCVSPLPASCIRSGGGGQGGAGTKSSLGHLGLTWGIEAAGWQRARPCHRHHHLRLLWAGTRSPRALGTRGRARGLQTWPRAQPKFAGSSRGSPKLHPTHGAAVPKTPRQCGAMGRAQTPLWARCTTPNPPRKAVPAAVEAGQGLFVLAPSWQTLQSLCFKAAPGARQPDVRSRGLPGDRAPHARSSGGTSPDPIPAETPWIGAAPGVWGEQERGCCSWGGGGG